ncbi:MAG TPA: twin-arginine translocase TatA/TatE family subunit [Thermoleophilaceae bacterium]|jgi:sec-independent protein translocase protein TatA
MFSAPGPLELAVILILALIVLGPKRLPEAARSVGRGVRELREAMSAPDFGSYDDDDDEDENELDDRFVADDEPAEHAAPAKQADKAAPARPSTADHS